VAPLCILAPIALERVDKNKLTMGSALSYLGAGVRARYGSSLGTCTVFLSLPFWDLDERGKSNVVELYLQVPLFDAAAALASFSFCLSFPFLFFSSSSSLLLASSRSVTSSAPIAVIIWGTTAFPM